MLVTFGLSYAIVPSGATLALRVLSSITSASPAGHGGATGHRTTLGDRALRGNPCRDPNQHAHIVDRSKVGSDNNGDICGFW